MALDVFSLGNQVAVECRDYVESFVWVLDTRIGPNVQ